MRRLIPLSIFCLLTIALAISPAGLAKVKNNNQPMLAASMVDVEYGFVLVNKTGYNIVKLYLAPSSSEEWDESDELLKGQSFSNGKEVTIKYKTGKNAEAWDMMVGWDDGSANSKWHSLNLNGEIGRAHV